MSDPPPTPPIWEASVQKKFEGLFCVLGPKEHFWFLQKISLFVSILTYMSYIHLGIGTPPPSRKNSLPVRTGIIRFDQN